MSEDSLPAEIVIEGNTVEDASATPAHYRPTPPPAAPAGPMGLFGSGNPAETMQAMEAVATVLTDKLEERGLYKTIRDRKHVLVEGWTMLGSLTGVFPRTEWTRQIPDHEGNWRPPVLEERIPTLHSKHCPCGRKSVRVEIWADCQTWTPDKPELTVVEPGKGGWEARVEAVTLGGQVVGAAEAECRWDEKSWRNRDSHALRSMAGTRATSKALRLPLGFLVELAGFDATPAEEMTGIADAPPPADDTPADDRKCPECGSGIFDNLARRQGGWNGPAFKCRNRDCTGHTNNRTGELEPWCTWSESFFDPPEPEADYTGTAKKRILELTGASLERWDERYLSDQYVDTLIGEHVGELMIWESEGQLPDGQPLPSKAMLRAQVLWQDIVDLVDINEESDGPMTRKRADQLAALAGKLLENPTMDRAAVESAWALAIEDADDAEDDKRPFDDQEPPMEAYG